MSIPGAKNVKLEIKVEPTSCTIKNEIAQTDSESLESNASGGDFLIEEKFIPEDPGEPSKFFICKFCSKLFKMQGNLAEHLKGYCKRKSSTYCKLCRKTFPSSSTYSNHEEKCKEYFQKIGNGEGRFVCPIGGCLAEFKSKESLNTHQCSVHIERNFICQFCGLKFKMLRHKSRHELRIHGSNAIAPKSSKEVKVLLDNLKTKIGKASSSKGSVKKRIKLEEVGEIEDQKVRSRPVRSTRKKVDYSKLDTDSDSSGGSPCSNSSKNSRKKPDSEGETDFSDSEAEASEDSDIPSSSNEVKGHTGISQDKNDQIPPTGSPVNPQIFNCPNCLQSFESNEELQEHWEFCVQITISDLIQCPISTCSATFPKESYCKYNAHIDKHDGQERRKYPNKKDNPACDICGKNWFKSRAKFNEHCSLPHPISCVECPSRFVTNEDLEIHVKKCHFEDAKKFHCLQDGCTTSFREKARLQRHEVTVHQRKFALDCPICLEKLLFGGRGKKMHTHLLRHKNTGKNKVKCEICNVFFTNRDLLRTHEEKSEIHLKRLGKSEGTKTDEEFILPDEEPNPIDSLLAQYSSTKKERDSGILEDSDSETESFPCDKCELSFKNNYFRVKHQRAVHGLISIHPSYQNFYCELCDSSFLYKRSYDEHVANSLGHKARLKQMEMK